MVTMTRDRECNAPTACLLLAFELGQRSWKLRFSAGIGQRPRVRQIPAGAVSRTRLAVRRCGWVFQQRHW